MGATGGGGASGGRITGGDSRPRLHSGGDSGPSGGRASRATNPRDAGASHLCTFTIGAQRYALPTSIVRELVAIERITPVPRTPPAILGLFNLRGEPMPLVDLSLLLLGTPSPAATKFSVIILRSETVSVGARIDALGTVVAHQGVMPTDDADPLFAGFIDVVGHGAVAVIEAGEFMSRIDSLKAPLGV